MRRFFAPPEHFNAENVTLSADETRHLRDVLRLKSGDEAQVFDGDGGEYLCVITEVRKSAAILRILDRIEPTAPESVLDLTLAASIYKSDKLDLVVQKAVELGVSRFSPIVTFRGEVKLRDTAKRTERWRKIALEATKQCERAKVMQIDEIVTLEDYVASVSSDPGLRLIFSEKGGGAIPATAGSKKITALVGPKGGWEDSEIDLAAEQGFVPVKLGRRIMRAETAAITFAALLQHRFGDLH
jgi:16S rRNA (uracil1498-N3)-methyltransferase